MVRMAETEPETRSYISWPQAAFIGVAAMVGAGIFSLLGAAGEVAGAAVWLSFALAGIIAGIQGYSFAKLGARYPSAAGLLEYVRQGFGDGHFTGIAAWMTYSVNTIVTAMVAVSFGSYASAMFANESKVWAKAFAALIVLIMVAVNIMGSTLVARAQSVIVFIVIGILAVFAVVTIANMDSSLLAPSGYPPLREIFSSVALTFFAFLGFGIVTYTAKDLREPSRELPRAMYLALGIATVIYIAVSLGVFGTLTVEKVIASGGTALAVAAEPSLGQAGYWLMSVTGLFATAGATNGGLYPAAGLCEQLASSGPVRALDGASARRSGARGPADHRCGCRGAGGRVQFDRDRLHWQRRRIAHLLSGHCWTFPSPFRNWCSSQRPGAGRSHHRSSLPDVRLHNLDRRAGIGGDTCADLTAQLQPGFRLETTT
jgi:amino acid transporter